MSVRPRTTNPQSRCPGSLEGTAYVQRVQQYIENKQDIKPKDRIAFKVLVRHFVHNRDRKLVDAALDLIIPEGFSCFSYNPADYTDLVSSSPEPCCSKAKLFIEFVYFFRKFHEKSSANATRRRELTILSSIILLSRDITEEELLKFADTSAEEIASIIEYQQIKPIDEAISMGDSLKIERLGNLKYFRRAQEIRDAHGVARSPRLVRCFQSMRDIDEMVKQLKEQNPVEFLVQAYALGLIEPRLLRKMYHTPKDYTQLVALLDRTAVVRSYYESRSTNEDHTRMFITAFRQLSRLRATWTQTLLLFLLGINVPVGWYLPRMDLETIPNDHLHIFLNYLLTYSYKSLIKPEHGIQDLDLMENLSRLPSMVRRLLEREASPYYVTHSHDAVKQLLKNDCPSLQVAGAYIEKRCPMYSSLGVILRLPRNWQQLSFVGMMPDFCCPVRRDDTTIVFDNTRIASLSCLAARSYKLDRELSELPAKLHGMILFHQDLKRLIKPGTTWLEFLAQNSPTHSRQ